MKLLRYITCIVFFVATFNVQAGEEKTTKAQGTTDQANSKALQLLQGRWEGVQVGDEAKISITITSNELHFHRDADFWFKTTIALPAGKNPKQLHATINSCPPSQADSIGKVVKAFYQIKNGTFTLATIGDDAEETAEGFAEAGTRYKLRKAEPLKKYLQLPNIK